MELLEVMKIVVAEMDRYQDVDLEAVVNELFFNMSNPEQQRFFKELKEEMEEE